MTDLQIVLMGAGGAFLAGIVAYNKWQEYKAKKSVDQAFGSGHDDVLMNPDALAESRLGDDGYDAPRHEPSLDADFPDDNNSDFGQQASASMASAVSAATSFEVAEKELPVDDLIDCIIPLEFDAPVRGEKLLMEIQGLKYVGKKPVHFIGLSHDGVRDVIAHGGIYTSLFAGVQMVSRGGPLNELEYSEFVTKLREIADRLNAHPDIPDMNRVMSNARELHQFVSEHDAQLSVNVMSNGAPWGVSTLLAALEKQGFDVRPDGRLVMPDGDGGNLFTLSTNVSVSETVTGRLTLLLDVPCVAPLRDGFGAMAACAKSLATRLGGTVVDDGNQPISKVALDEIAGQVNEFYAAMAEADIAAGSTRAQRLFS
ncbi:cell division protein [Undibacterium sp. Jales W-56]|uniref:cell division protein ZipA C-terminal FtsZ-binding domain-containing protein n=1 Tax=Undibacterium sp. Jales W-56 TaxID=2897325 RepID=UPI0021CF1B9B|nr:cell division protein ZipA C-terminal FtsZ-binding domain-containing protein [Undibacterium sp. Jales W-56]MCU6433622.1 cell division protein [Undibacterium sp. Jales W-56]